MKILIDIDHPSTVHLFKNFIKHMQQDGHTILITAIEKELVFDLLKECQLTFVSVGDTGTSKLQKILKLPSITHKIYKIVKKERPDLIMGAATIPGAWVAKMCRIPCINFDDTEIAKVAHALYTPFAEYIISPEHYGNDFGKKHVRYKGYKELAYVHPNSFTPDASVLKDLGVILGEKYFVVRFSAWGATHDIGKAGLSLENKRALIALLRQQGRVFISSEGELEAEFECYRYQIESHKILDALYYAQMLVTDAHTMATEAALLGTPALRCNSIVGSNDMRNFTELEDCYELLYSYRHFDDMIIKLNELLAVPDLKVIWSQKVEKMLKDKVDLTQWMINFVNEQYVAQEGVCT